MHCLIFMVLSVSTYKTETIVFPASELKGCNVLIVRITDMNNGSLLIYQKV